MLLEELARLRHRAARGSWRRWRRHGEVGVPRYTAKTFEGHDRRETFKANVGAEDIAVGARGRLDITPFWRGRRALTKRE